jgi:protein ImuB
MKWLAIHFPLLPLEIFTRGQAIEAPLAVGIPGRVPRVLLCNRLAEMQGVCPGMAQGAAQALVGDLRILQQDREAESRALQNLAAWSSRFSSYVSVASRHTLVLETAGSLRLFGGLEQLLRQLRTGLRALGYQARVCAAPTPAGAELMASAGQQCIVPDRHALRVRLSSLPLTALRLEGDQHGLLERMGLRSLGQVLRLPRDGLAGRLGPAFVQRLDRLLGDVPDPRTPFNPPLCFQAHLVLPVETQNACSLLFGGRRLLGELEGYLLARQSGVQHLAWRLIHADPPSTDFALGLAVPSRNSGRFVELLRHRLERLRLPAPVRELELRADNILQLPDRAGELFADTGRREFEEGQYLLERLQARLGHQGVRGIRSRAEYRPELAWEYCRPGQGSDEYPHAGRPLWLLTKPLALQQAQGRPRYKGGLHLEGERERIESGWWDGFDVRRDYFVARSGNGERFWVFRTRDGERAWYLHGVFG